MSDIVKDIRVQLALGVIDYDDVIGFLLALAKCSADQDEITQLFWIAIQEASTNRYWGIRSSLLNNANVDENLKEYLRNPTKEIPEIIYERYPKN